MSRTADHVAHRRRADGRVGVERERRAPVVGRLAPFPDGAPRREHFRHGLIEGRHGLPARPRDGRDPAPRRFAVLERRLPRLRQADEPMAAKSDRVEAWIGATRWSAVRTATEKGVDRNNRVKSTNYGLFGTCSEGYRLMRRTWIWCLVTAQTPRTRKAPGIPCCGAAHDRRRPPGRRKRYADTPLADRDANRTA